MSAGRTAVGETGVQSLHSGDCTFELADVARLAVGSFRIGTSPDDVGAHAGPDDEPAGADGRRPVSLAAPRCDGGIIAGSRGRFSGSRNRDCNGGQAVLERGSAALQKHQRRYGKPVAAVQISKNILKEAE